MSKFERICFLLLALLCGMAAWLCFAAIPTAPQPVKAAWLAWLFLALALCSTWLGAYEGR